MPTLTVKMKYHGVIETEGRFVAVIFKGGKLVTLGTYDTAEQAAMVYDTVAFAMLGDIAHLNFSEMFEGDGLVTAL